MRLCITASASYAINSNVSRWLGEQSYLVAYACRHVWYFKEHFTVLRIIAISKLVIENSTVTICDCMMLL